MPAWRADGREIYYVRQDGMLMAAPSSRNLVSQSVTRTWSIRSYAFAAWIGLGGRRVHPAIGATRPPERCCSDEDRAAGWIESALVAGTTAKGSGQVHAAWSNQAPKRNGFERL